MSIMGGVCLFFCGIMFAFLGFLLLIFLGSDFRFGPWR